MIDLVESFFKVECDDVCWDDAFISVVDYVTNDVKVVEDGAVLNSTSLVRMDDVGKSLC